MDSGKYFFAIVLVGVLAGALPNQATAVVLGDYITDSFWNDNIIGKTPKKKRHADRKCPGSSFYTREALLEAAASHSECFCTSTHCWQIDEYKRQIAAYLAHLTYETQHLCLVEKKDGVFCDATKTQYPCASGKEYYSRGPLMTKWSFNYGRAASLTGLDFLNNPDIVSTDALLSFRFSLSYWETNVRDPFTLGFAETIRVMSPEECDGKDPAAVDARVGYYLDYCQKLGVDHTPINAIGGDNLTCN